MKKIDNGLKNYIVKNDLVNFVDFESFIDKDDGCPCQILVLNRPKDIILELTDSPWTFELSKVALVYNCKTKEAIFIPLKFDFLLPGTEELEKFDFGSFSQIKRCKNQIILAQRYFGGEGYPECLNVAIFDVTGKLLSAWRIDGYYRDQKIDSFRACDNGCFLVEFVTKDFKKTLVLLTRGNSKEYDLHLRTMGGQENGRLVDADVNKIQTWFSDTEASPKFFILVSPYQLCAYSLQKHGQFEQYEMMTNIVMASHIENFKVVVLGKSFAVDFEVKTSWIGNSNFFLNFEPEVSKE